MLGKGGCLSVAGAERRFSSRHLSESLTSWDGRREAAARPGAQRLTLDVDRFPCRAKPLVTPSWGLGWVRAEAHKKTDSTSLLSPLCVHSSSCFHDGALFPHNHHFLHSFFRTRFAQWPFLLYRCHGWTPSAGDDGCEPIGYLYKTFRTARLYSLKFRRIYSNSR